MHFIDADVADSGKQDDPCWSCGRKEKHVSVSCLLIQIFVQSQPRIARSNSLRSLRRRTSMACAVPAARSRGGDGKPAKVRTTLSLEFEGSSHDPEYLDRVAIGPKGLDMAT